MFRAILNATDYNKTSVMKVVKTEAPFLETDLSPIMSVGVIGINDPTAFIVSVVLDTLDGNTLTIPVTKNITVAEVSQLAAYIGNYLEANTDYSSAGARGFLKEFDFREVNGDVLAYSQNEFRLESFYDSNGIVYELEAHGSVVKSVVPYSITVTGAADLVINSADGTLSGTFGLDDSSAENLAHSILNRLYDNNITSVLAAAWSYIEVKALPAQAGFSIKLHAVNGTYLAINDGSTEIPMVRTGGGALKAALKQL